MSELNGGIPIEVDPTIELHARVEMGGTASEYNAEAWAVGERGGVPVSSTDQTYHNNSKYYAEQAAEDVQEVNNASAKIDNMTVEGNTGLPGSSVSVTITEVSGHKHIAFTIPQGAKGETGSAGKDFHIAFTFPSIASMIAYSGDIELFDYAMIDTGNVQDADTGKLYCYEQDEEWHYIGDLSGAQGIKGETGTGISSIVLNQDYTLTINLDDGTYYTTTSIRGAKGDTGDTGTGIASAVLNQDYTLTINFDDGTSYTTPNSIRGITGATPNIVIGTVSTLQPGQPAYVTLDPSSTAERPVLNIGIPKGDTGTMENTYGSTIEMTPSDSTKISTAISGKADKVSNAVSGNFAGLDANGNLTDSGHKHSDYLTQHQDISGKADKVSSAVSGNFAGLDANGNLTDSGSKASDFLTQHQDISGKANLDAIHYVENGTTASRAYSEGEYLYYTPMHNVYVASEDISAGETLLPKIVPASSPISKGVLNDVAAKLSGAISDNSDAIANLNNKYFALDSATGLPNNTNFNSLITAGCWRILSYSSASTMTNIPKASAGTLYIKNSMLETGSDYIEQMYWTHQNEIFLRYTSDKGSTWSGWQELAKKSDIVAETKTISNSESIGANSVKSFSVSATKTGYTPVGIISITGSGTSGLVLQEYYIFSNNATVYYRNASSSAVTPSRIDLTILYKAN